MMQAARTSETSVDNYFTRQYIPEDNSELHTRRRENLKSHIQLLFSLYFNKLLNGKLKLKHIFVPMCLKIHPGILETWQ
jgi:hypothetical protein